MIEILSFFTSLFPVLIYLMCKYVIVSASNVWIMLLHPMYFITDVTKCVITSLFIGDILFLFALKIYISTGKDKSCDLLYIRRAEKDKMMTTQYLLSNVLPILSMSLDKWYDIVFTIFLLAGLLILYIKNNLLYMNPLFDLIGINVYNAKARKIDRYTSQKGSYEDVVIISSKRLLQMPCKIEAENYKGIYIFRKEAVK